MGTLPALACAVLAATSPPSTRATITRPVVHTRGGAYLWYYQPLQRGAKNDFQLYTAYADLDARLHGFTFHIEPRLRLDKLRSYYPGNVWVQEVYLAAGPRWATLKVGKVYSHLGRFWDDSFYGNLLYFDGLTLDPELGASLEGRLGGQRGPTLHYFAQFFLVDGQTNGSLPGRDTLSYPGARKRNHGLVRLAPGWRISQGASIVLGGTADFSQSDFGALGTHQVWRFEGDLTAHLGPVAAFGEVLVQRGRSVLDFPFPGRTSAHDRYFWTGIEADLGRFAPRYNLSVAEYRDAGVTEVMHQPGLTVKVSRNLALLGEVALWSRAAPGGRQSLDKSLNLILFGHL